jgi:hypothetical protein
MNAAHATVTLLNTRMEHLVYNLYMDNFFASKLLSNLHTKAINCYGTIRPNWQGIPSEFGKKLKTEIG